MIEKVLNRKNLYKAYRQVVQNKGSAGVDGMKVTELFSYLEDNRDSIAKSILNHTYVPKPIKGVEIPKSNGKTRLLGVPTVVDRWLQQAVGQVLMTKYELTFEDHSYGFRPEKNIHKAVTQALKNRAERLENFLWKFLARSQAAGGMAIRILWTSILKDFLTKLTIRFYFN